MSPADTVYKMWFTTRQLIIGGLIGLGCLALGIAGLQIWSKYASDWQNAGSLTSGDERLPVTVGGETLSVPANVLRFADDRRKGNRTRLELVMKWPGLGGLAPQDAALNTTAKDGRLIFISIEPRETDLDTADRIATIYQKFLGSADQPGPDGLIRRDFNAGTSYEGEQLYFEPGSVHPFAARCFPPDKDQPPVTCLRDVRMGKRLSATIRFPKAALDHWRDFGSALDGLLDAMVGG